MTLYCNIFNASASASASAAATTSLSMFYSSAIARTMMAEIVVDEAADNMVDIITDDNASINVLSKDNTTTVEEVAAASEEEEEELTTNFKHMFAIVVPRITGCIALFVSFGMFYMAYKRRDRIFHRLVFGMTVHICLSSIFDIYGNAAVPAAPIGTGTGTITTCTIQGFFLYVTWATSLLYYATLCIYSYVGIMNNFITNKYKWIEKYIHICVHIYPISLGLTYVYYKAYNDTGMGYCDILGKAYNSPLFIDNDKLVQEVQSYLRVSFYIFLLLFPTIVMIILYYKVKFNQETIYVIRPVNIVKQTIIYVFPLYWTLLPYIIIFISEIVMSMNWENNNEDYETNIDSKNTTKSPETISQIVYPFYAYADINYFLFSVWCFLAYFYFSYYDSDSDSDIDDSSAAAPAAEDRPLSATVTAGINATLRTNECIFNTHSNIEDNDDNNNGNNNETQQLQNDHNPTTTTTEARIGEEADNNKRRSRRSSSNGSGSGNIRRRRTKSRKYSFNIFDGTNASGAFADFVHDGDSEDEKIDNEQTKHWEIVQDYV